MAKKVKGVTMSTAYNTAILTAVLQATDAGGVHFVTADEGMPLVTAGLINVNTENLDPTDGNKAAATITDAGRKVVADANAPKVASQPIVGASFALMSNIPLPEAKRGKAGGGGAPSKYPFEKMEVGNSFFVPKSAELEDPVKTLQSTVSSANLRYSEVIEGQFEEVTRTKRGAGNKAVVVDGVKQKETVKVPKRKPLRKFAIRSVKQGDKLGDWVAPADGALIARVPLPA